nr:hypothetical protein [Eubacterium sp.]
MTKRKTTMLTLALAGAMVVTGVGGLYGSIAQARKSDHVAQVETASTETMADKVEKVEKVEGSQKQTWLEKESMYLPEGAKLKELKGGNYKIKWDGSEILVYHRDSVMAKESKKDLGLAKLLPILQDAVKKYSGQDMEKCQMEVCMYDGFTTEYSFTAKVFNYTDKYYEVNIKGVPNFTYNICVNSVTGEILGYDQCDLSKGDYKEMVDGENKKVPAEEKKECGAIAEAFVKDELKMGKVDKTFAISYIWRIIGEKSEREGYSMICKTENGDVVELAIDAEDKTVQSFSVSPVY